MSPQYPTVTPFEHFDSERTHRFTGTPALPEGRLAVSSRRAPGIYPGPYNLVTRRPGELFVLFGVYAEVAAAHGAEIARLDAETLQEVWRTRLIDCREDGRWNYMGVLGVLPDGDLVAIYSNFISRLDPTTGAATATATLPFQGPGRDAAYNGYTLLSDGMLVAKTVHRAGTDRDGFAAFMSGNILAAPCSTVTVIDPATFEVRASMLAPEHIGGRITSTTLDGRDVIYLVGFTKLYRYLWDGRSLTEDPDWTPVTVRRNAQTPAPANAVLDGFTALQTNAVPSPDPLSVHCISQRDPSSNGHHEVQPFADVRTPVSFLPAMLSVDPENRRIYTHDSAAGRLAALDVAGDGSMTTAWRVEQRSLSFTTLVGPPDRRVIVGTDLPGLDSVAGILKAPTEQVVWRDAATGSERARSQDLPRMSPGVLVTPGFDGVFYQLGHHGILHELKLEVS